MKRLLIAVVLIAVVVAAVGLYLGWFRFSSGSDQNEANATLSVDKEKIQEDKDKVADKIHDVGR